jgi:hypothetical protein
MNNPVRFTETGCKYSLIVDFYMANQKVLGKKTPSEGCSY